MVKDRDTAENRREFTCEPMNHTVHSLGFAALREVRLLRVRIQYIVMQSCDGSVEAQSVETFIYREMIHSRLSVERKKL